MLTHLNNGTGNPCAGHNRAKPVPNVASKEKIFEAEENAGALKPIGSKVKREGLFI